MAFDLHDSFPTLRNAPITEAVIDIKAELPPSIGLEALSKFADGDPRFPQRIERRSLEPQIIQQQGAAPKVIPPSNEPDGYVFSSSTDFLVAQARLNGFTLSRIKPYHDGDTFLAQARDLWERYCGIAHPTRVKRLAIRNVNRIEMLPDSDLERYVLTCPGIARSLPQRMLNFFLRLVLPDESGAIALVTQAIAPTSPDDVSVVPLIFDIDVFLEVDLAPDSPQIWDTISTLRKLKNRIFFKSLTTESLEAFR
jgi:uncharacterized protein (TIGR04255 family)